MARLKANGIELEYEIHGDPKSRPLLLIMGLGAQLITWDEGFVDELVKRGFYVIRYDNRDSGLSSKMESAGPADIAAAYAGNRSEEHTSELQSHVNLVCRLLLEKKKKPHGPRR